MNKMKQKTMEIFSKIVKGTAEKEADSACLLFAYQPKMPEQLKKKNK